MFGVKQLISQFCAMKETLDFFIVKVQVKKNKGSCEAALFSCLKIGCNSDNLVTFGDEKLK